MRHVPLTHRDRRANWVPPPVETLGFGVREDEQSEQMSDGLPVGGIPLALPIEEDGVTFAALKASLSVPVLIDMKACRLDISSSACRRTSSSAGSAPRDLLRR